MGRAINHARYLLIIIGALTMYCGPLARADDAPAIPQSLLLAYLADNNTFTLIDARSPGEFEASHIAGAINVPVGLVDEFEVRLPGNRDRLVVVYCKTGERAATLQSQLAERGYMDVRVLQSNQMVWYESMAVFNCATPSPQDSIGEQTARLVDELWEETK